MSATDDQIGNILSGHLAELDRCIRSGEAGAAGRDAVLGRMLQLLRQDHRTEVELNNALQRQSGELLDETSDAVGRLLQSFASEDVPTMRETAVEARVSQDNGGALSIKNADVLEQAMPSQSSEANDESVRVGTVLRDRFLLERQVSGGSMGVVYKALDRRLAESGAKEANVAIKVLSAQLSQSAPALRALQQEAAKGRYLTHPNIVRFIDLDREGDLYFIVLEWLEGRTLAEILDSPESRKIDLQRALKILRQVSAALEHAHRCGIVHADIKPGNIMIDVDGNAKLFDFGVARVRQSHEKHLGRFDPGVLGALTPAYSSMQVLTGDEPVPQDDVFSLGCLFYRLVAGHRVFGPRNAAEAAEEGLKPQRIGALSDRQWAALSKSLAYSRIMRYESVAEFIADIDAADAGERLEVGHEDGLVAHQPVKRRATQGLLLVLLLAAAFFAYQHGRFDDLASSLSQSFEKASPTPANAAVLPEIVSEELPSPEQAEFQATEFEPLAEEATASSEAATAAPDTPRAIDYSFMPAADFSVSLTKSTTGQAPVTVVLREEAPAVSIDFLRSDSLESPLRLKVEEVAHSGNRSPWAGAQYSITSGDIIDIPAGQDRARITLQMTPDPIREADQTSRLRIRQAETTLTQLAALEIVLEDDDQRRFEENLPQDTIAFNVGQLAVSERDPAVQIDVVRFNPSDQPVVVGYSVLALTATEGEDYFLPGSYSLSFGPGQRSTRVLIPLVQDTLIERDESFIVEIASPNEELGDDVHQRMMVIVEDDELS